MRPRLKSGRTLRGLAVLVAMSAIVAPASAQELSATSSGTDYTGTIQAASSNMSFDDFWLDLVCSSAFTGTIDDPAFDPDAAGEVSTLTMSNCTPDCALEVSGFPRDLGFVNPNAAPSEADLTIAGPFSISKLCSGVRCVFTRSAPLTGHITEGTPAELVFGGVTLSTSFACGLGGTWSAHYHVRSSGGGGLYLVP